MFGVEFPNWVPILFFVVLLSGAYFVGKRLESKDRKYDGKF